MSLTHQYSGFLDSNVLWNTNILFELEQFDFKKLSISSSMPKRVEIAIRENEVLGKRIESFFEYCITASQRYKIIAKNLQVFKDRITIGELDFIILDLRKKEVLHIELIYKFYVYDPDTESELNRWIGPNRKDSLLEKIDKLKNKQLPLLFKSETRPILENLKIEQNIKQQVCFLGNLFVPLSYLNKSLPLLNNKCIVGYWINFEEFISQVYGSHQFHIPTKQEWIIKPQDCNIWLPFDNIYDEVQLHYKQKKSPLLWMKRGENSYDRFFVVWW